MQAFLQAAIHYSHAVALTNVPKQQKLGVQDPGI